jgi:hypothetical protein
MDMIVGIQSSRFKATVWEKLTKYEQLIDQLNCPYVVFVGGSLASNLRADTLEDLMYGEEVQVIDASGTPSNLLRMGGLFKYGLPWVSGVAYVGVTPGDSLVLRHFNNPNAKFTSPFGDMQLDYPAGTVQRDNIEKLLSLFT